MATSKFKSRYLFILPNLKSRLHILHIVHLLSLTLPDLVRIKVYLKTLHSQRLEKETKFVVLALLVDKL
jgi:hypothetical protein